MRRQALLAVAAVLTALAVPTPSSAAPAVLVSAHRGGAAYAPENTMVAFRNAVRLGVDELETDVQRTQDGTLVLMHDDTLQRTTSCAGTVSATSDSALARCDAGWWWSPGPSLTVPSQAAAHPLRGKGIRVPRLTDLLSYARSLGSRAPRLSIEIKDIPGESNFDPLGTAVAPALVAAIAASGVAKSRIVVQSFFPTAIEAVKRLDPALKTQFLTSSSTGETAAPNVAYVIARGHDIAAPNSDAPDLLAPLIELAHAAGKAVIPYTPDTRSAQRRAVELGVDGVITNRPACLLTVLGRPVPAQLLPVEAVRAGSRPVSACEGERPGAARFERPSPETCAALRPSRWAPPSGSSDQRGDLRVIGIQYKQDVANVASYDAFRTAMRCLVEDFVVPLQVRGRPTLVVFNEDIGLMTLATGTRGATVRAQATTPLRAPVGETAPLGAAAALGQLNAAYAPQVLAYQARFGPVDPRKQVLLAATDTFVRSFSHTFSDIARDYGIYVVAANNQAAYRASTDPADLALFADPEVGGATEAYVATSGHVANTAFVWGPHDVHPAAPRGERNLLHRNEKVPLTSTETTLLALDPGPSTGPAAIANVTGPRIASHRLGLATSLPAFQYGYPFGRRPAGFQPCADTSVSYMACMDAQGVDVVVQDEANPGDWASYQAGGWQPLEWMSSTWRAVTDPTVHFRYNVTPMLVGNLLDLPFDGQSAITARAGGQPGRAYIGNRERLDPRDPVAYGVYAGAKPQFLALAPWVTGDAPRTSLEATAHRLAPGSDDAAENAYLETAVYADLVPASGTARPAAPAGRGTLASTGAAPPYLALLLVALVLVHVRRRRAWS
ncbi:MAG: Glycerophosphoryl diester phosphodiesterase [Frankiales bacterium]|nr:Glycerophosphoryl diester phosphodiesterase [Frankiales bacterium]